MAQVIITAVLGVLCIVCTVIVGKDIKAIADEMSN